MTFVGLESAARLGTEAGTSRGSEGVFVPPLGEWAFEDDFSSGLGNWAVARARSIGAGDPQHISPADLDGSAVGDTHPPDDIVYDYDADNLLWISAGAQNYGDTMLRCNQQFDFTSGEGVIEAEVVLPRGNPLHGWAQISVTTRPYAWLSMRSDNASGPIPENGFSVRLNYGQEFQAGDYQALPRFAVWDDFTETIHGTPTTTGIDVPETTPVTVRLEFTSTSIDGFLDGVAWFSQSWTLPSELFAAPGWLYISAHNHATLKYGPGETASFQTQWGGVRFDGPPLGAPLTVHQVADNDDLHDVPADGGIGTDIGWHTPTSALSLPSLPPAAASAILTFTGFVSALNDFDDVEITYRLNGDTWHVVPVEDWPVVGVYIASQAVDPGELISGTNTIEFDTDLVVGSMADTPHVSDIQLLVEEA